MHALALAMRTLTLAMHTPASQARKAQTNGITAPPSAQEVRAVEDAYTRSYTALNQVRVRVRVRV